MDRLVTMELAFGEAGGCASSRLGACTTVDTLSAKALADGGDRVFDLVLLSDGAWCCRRWWCVFRDFRP
jgi:hypothetical protein